MDIKLLSQLFITAVFTATITGLTTWAITRWSWKRKLDYACAITRSGEIMKQGAQEIRDKLNEALELDEHQPMADLKLNDSPVSFLQFCRWLGGETPEKFINDMLGQLDGPVMTPHMLTVTMVERLTGHDGTYHGEDVSYPVETFKMEGETLRIWGYRQHAAPEKGYTCYVKTVKGN